MHLLCIVYLAPSIIWIRYWDLEILTLVTISISTGAPGMSFNNRLWLIGRSTTISYARLFIYFYEGSTENISTSEIDTILKVSYFKYNSLICLEGVL